MNIKIFASQVRQLILQLRKLKQENADLEATIQKLKEENVQATQALKAMQVEYNSLMMGKCSILPTTIWKHPNNV